MVVFSAFDGVSCGQVALERAGHRVEAYIASEIEKPAIKVTQKNYPNTYQLGDITKIDASILPEIDLMFGGSPCQGFSIAGDGLNFDDPRSKLFFDFVRLRDRIKPKYFLLENVNMKQEWQDVITDYMGVQPIKINSALVSAQNRVRLYWTNIPSVTEPEDRNIALIDILEEEVNDKYYHSEAALNYMNRATRDGRNHWDFAHHSDTNRAKSACITANFRKGVPYNVLIDRRGQVTQLNPFQGCSTDQPKMQHRIFDTQGKSTALTSFAGRLSVYPDKCDLIRRLTPVECERLQTLPDNYTAGVADSHRYNALGNGWTVDVISHIVKNL
jgi:site-specific DNA-cytosine methylase